ncbi:MAG: flagellar type III secretion system pore protein FliP [Deltaproteobacteria bacterium]|nr:flagellar type III secretion system pore protein FliP [Deltaproteobacteria bacterium]
MMKGLRTKGCLVMALIVLFAAIILPSVSWAAAGISLPSLSITFDKAADEPERVSSLMQLLMLLTVLTLAPAILVMLTSFTRIVVVLSLLRHALGTQQIPSNQIVVGLSLFLTFFIMTPVWNQVNDDAVKPYMEERISFDKALSTTGEALKGFMLKHTREKDIGLFQAIARRERPATADDIGLSVLIPAFVISELKTAFQIGFMIYLPFLILDMVVASVLLSMGMMMLPPIMISLPFKLLLFVLVDGWYLVVGSLVESFK